MEPVNSYYCDICKCYYNGPAETIFTDECPCWAFNGRGFKTCTKWHSCRHTDNQITKAIYEEHMVKLSTGVLTI